MTNGEYLLSEYNEWGTLKRDINPDEYCVECEQDIRLGHYSFCPALQPLVVPVVVASLD